MYKRSFLALIVLTLTLVLFLKTETKSSKKEQGLSPTYEITKNMPLPLQEKVEQITNPEAKIDSLPTIENLKALPEEQLHHTPEIILNGGALIGRIEDQAQQNPSARKEAMRFFKECAEAQNIALPLRAVCLRKIHKLIPDWEIPVLLSNEKISPEVLELSKELP